MELSGKKVAVLADNMYQEMEIWYPLYRLREAGAEVVVLGAKVGEIYTSKLGYPVVATAAYEDASASEFDGVVVPGGFAPDIIRRYSVAVQFVKDMDEILKKALVPEKAQTKPEAAEREPGEKKGRSESAPLSLPV